MHCLESLWIGIYKSENLTISLSFDIVIGEIVYSSAYYDMTMIAM